MERSSKRKKLPCKTVIKNREMIVPTVGDGIVVETDNAVGENYNKAANAAKQNDTAVTASLCGTGRSTVKGQCFAQHTYDLRRPCGNKLTVQSRSFFQDIPEDILEHILVYLNTEDRWRVAGVCQSWRKGAMNLNYCRDFIVTNMTPQRIIELLPYLPLSVIQFDLEYKDNACSRTSQKQTAALFLEFMRHLRYRCPSIKSLTIKNICYKILKCHACSSENIEDGAVHVVNNHDIEKSCEFEQYKDILPPVECLSLRNLHLICGKKKDYRHRDAYSRSPDDYEELIYHLGMIFSSPYLKVLDLRVTPEIENFRFPSTFFSNIYLLSNMEELYVSSGFFSTLNSENLFKTLKHLRVFCYSMWNCLVLLESSEELFNAAQKYAHNLEKMCLTQLHIQVPANNDNDLGMQKLRILCLNYCHVSIDTMQKLLNSYHSLHSVYIPFTNIHPQYFKGKIADKLIKKLSYKHSPKGNIFCDHFIDNGYGHP